MHEASIARDVIETVEDRIARGQLSGKVEAVCLRVGRLTAVVPDNLRFMFRVLSEGTALEGARLEIEHVPVRGRCRDCKAEFEISEVYFRCPGCGSAEVEILSGSELMLDAVEVA